MYVWRCSGLYLGDGCRLILLNSPLGRQDTTLSLVVHSPRLVYKFPKHTRSLPRCQLWAPESVRREHRHYPPHLVNSDEQSWIYTPQCGFISCTQHTLKKTIWNNSQKLKIYFNQPHRDVRRISETFFNSHFRFLEKRRYVITSSSALIPFFFLSFCLF